MLIPIQGGLVIADYSGSVDQLRIALHRLETVDCLTIRQAENMVNLKFFVSLRNITGLTLNAIADKETGVRSTVKCPGGKLQIIDNFKRTGFQYFLILIYKFCVFS